MNDEKKVVENVEEETMDITVVEKENFFDKVKKSKVVKPVLAVLGIGLTAVAAYALGRNSCHDDGDDDGEECYEFDKIESNDVSE